MKQAMRNVSQVPHSPVRALSATGYSANPGEESTCGEPGPGMISTA